MKNFLFVISFVCVSISVGAQRDTLQRYPFLYLYDWPETGVYHDSVFCDVEDNSWGIPVPGVMEYATYQHIDVNLKAVGIATGKCYVGFSMHSQENRVQIRLSLYNQNMERLRQTYAHELYFDWSEWYTDTNFRVLTLPGKHAWGEPLDSTDMILRFAYFDQPIEIGPGDYYLGIAQVDKTDLNSRSAEVWDLPYVQEHHDPPYCFRNDIYKYYKNNQWHDSIRENLLSSMFLIIEPECHEAENVRAVTDTTGCVTVEWDTLRWQTQWVLRLEGPDGTRYDTVDTNSHTYCDLVPHTPYEVSVMTQCYRPGGHNWSSWSNTVSLESNAIPSAEALGNHLILSPNPACGQVGISSPLPMTRIEVHNALGRCLYDRPTSGLTYNLDVSAWPAGTYLLRLHTHTGIITKKLLVR